MLNGKRSQNIRLYNKLTTIFTSGYSGPIYEKWLECEDEQACFVLERFLIKSFGRENLCNIMSGGQNPPSRLGSKHSADQKQKLTKAQKAAWAKSGYRDKMKAMRKAASAKPGAWEKKSAFLKVAFAKPAEKERKSKAAKREMDRPERKEQSRAVLTALWKSMSPEQRAQRAQKTLATRRANLAYCQIVAK